MQVKNKIDVVLAKIEERALGGTEFLPIIGPEKGKFDYLIVRVINAKRILDLGTLIGYSALLFAKAVGKKGKVTTIEINEENAKQAEANFRNAKVKNIKLIIGDAKIITKKLKVAFDLILLDTWKEDYVKLLPDCVRLLHKGGVLLTDNALWKTKEMENFRNALFARKDLESMIVSIGDGIAFSVKKSIQT